MRNNKIKSCSFHNGVQFGDIVVTSLSVVKHPNAQMEFIDGTGVYALFNDVEIIIPLGNVNFVELFPSAPPQKKTSPKKK